LDSTFQKAQKGIHQTRSRSQETTGLNSGIGNDPFQFGNAWSLMAEMFLRIPVPLRKTLAVGFRPPFVLDTFIACCWAIDVEAVELRAFSSPKEGRLICDKKSN